MQTLSRGELLGFVELQVGSIPVQVPIRSADPKTGDAVQGPVAAFTVEGDAYAIVVRGDASEGRVQQAVATAAKDALKHLSRKLLN